MACRNVDLSDRRLYVWQQCPTLWIYHRYCHGRNSIRRGVHRSWLKNGSVLTAASEGGVLFGLRMVELDEMPIGESGFVCPILTLAEDLTSGVACLI